MSVKWISHRGESYDAPQNTLPAFELSRERATDGMTCDVRFTKDRRLVVCHDPTTCSTCDACAQIARVTYEQLCKISVVFRKGGFKGVHIPLFEDTLAALGPDRDCYIEIRENDAGLLEKTAKALEKHAVPVSQVVIISSIPQMVRAAKDVIPGVRTLLLKDCSEEGFCAECLIAELKAAHADGVDLNADQAFMTSEFIGELKSEGFFVAVWAVDGTELAARCIAAGVDSITSSRAAWLRDQLAGA